jgi:hypothetical protein
LPQGTDARASGAPFPFLLLGRLEEHLKEGHLLQLSLWHGEILLVRSILERGEDGLIAELEPPPGEAAAGRAPVVAAVPWTSIAAARTVAAPLRRARPGFLPEA